jgi:hypothetical protein
MRFLAFTLLVAVLPAQANPALHGTWSAAVDGQPWVVVFKPDGNGSVNDKPLKWQTLGKLLFVQAQGEQAQTYSWDVKDGKLSVAGGSLNGVATLTRGTAAADAAKAKLAAAPAAAKGAGAGAVSGSGQELVGKWCLMSTFSANSGGSQRMTCFELKPDYTYTYRHEGSMSASTGGAASQSADAGRWKVSGNQLIAQSSRGTTSTYALEKRNHPKNKRDPMICLNGECYVTYYNKPPW